MRSYFQKKASSREDDREAIELAYWLQNSSPNDPTVLDRLVNHYGRELFRWVEILAYYRKKTQLSQAEILDILKVVFETAIKRVEQFHGNDNVSEWLFGIAYQVTNRWRFSPESQVVNQRLHQVTEFIEQPQKLLLADEDNLRLIPEKIRTTLILRYLYQLRLPEIARIVGIQENDVHQQLIKGRKKLLKNPVKSHMELKIHEYLDGMLDDDVDQLDELRRHTTECEDCQPVLEQLVTLENVFADELEARWELPTLSNEVLTALIQAITDEIAELETRWTVRLPLRQIAWIIGLGLMLAGMAVISIRITPPDKEIAHPDTTPSLQLPPIVEMQQPVGISQNRFDVPRAPQYIAPAFSNDGKWGIFAATNYSLSSQSLAFQTIDLYNRDANTIQVISESSPFVNSWVWWDLAPSISGDGSQMVYVSITREPHVSGEACSTQDHRSCLDIFLYDRISGETKRLTQTVNGGAANGDSLAPTISEDGQWVAFWSTADNLVEGFNNTCDQNGITIACLYIYLYNVQTGKISWIPIRTIPGDNVYGVDRISLSADGRYVGFTVSASSQAGIPSLSSPLTMYIQGEATGSAIVNTYIPTITHSTEAIIYDRETAKYELENQSQDGVPGNGPSSSPIISANGNYVAFVSSSSNLTPGDNNNYSDVFVRDRETGRIELVSVSSTGQSGQGDSGYISSSRGFYSINISDDGRYVVFESSAYNLGIDNNPNCTTGVNNDCHYLYIHDRQAGSTSLISVLTNQDFTLFPDISSNGEWISFMQYFHNCSSSQSQCSNVMLYDKQSNWTANITKFDSDTPTLRWSYSGSLSIPWQSWENTAFALSPDSTQIAVGGYDSKVRIWKASDINNTALKGGPSKILETAGNDSFSSLAFSADGQLLAGGTTTGIVYVWKLSDGELMYSNQDQPDLVRDLVFTQNGLGLVVATLHTAWTWRFGDNQMYLVDGFSPNQAVSYGIDISPNGTMIASDRSDGTVWLQNLPEGKVIARLGTNQLSTSSLVFSRDGSLLATRSSNGTITIWHITGSGSEISSITLVSNYRTNGYVGDLAISPDDQYLASVSAPGEVNLWSIPDGKVFTLAPSITDGRVFNLEFGSSGDKLAIVFENEIDLWGIPKGSSSSYYVHATSDYYIDSKPLPGPSGSDMPGIQSPENSISVENADLTLAASLLPFKMVIPTHLPENISFRSASVYSDGSVLLSYGVGNPEGAQASLFIYEKNIPNSEPPTMTIGADASVLRTQVNTISGNASAEYVQGDWIGRQSYTPAMGDSLNGVTHDVWDWDNSSLTQRLRWQQNGILIGLYYQVYQIYSPMIYSSVGDEHLIQLSPILNQGDLVQIASDMVPFSEMNAVKISYIPGGKDATPSDSTTVIGMNQPENADFLNPNTTCTRGYLISK